LAGKRASVGFRFQGGFAPPFMLALEQCLDPALEESADVAKHRGSSHIHRLGNLLRIQFMLRNQSDNLQALALPSLRPLCPRRFKFCHALRS
jgi:hypothetical protein